MRLKVEGVLLHADALMDDVSYCADITPVCVPSFLPRFEEERKGWKKARCITKDARKTTTTTHQKE